MRHVYDVVVKVRRDGLQGLSYFSSCDFNLVLRWRGVWSQLLLLRTCYQWIFPP